MNISPKIIALTLSGLTSATLAVAPVMAAEVPGSEGVVVNIPQIDSGESVSVPDTASHQSSGPTDKHGNLLFPPASVKSEMAEVTAPVKVKVTAPAEAAKAVMASAAEAEVTEMAAAAEKARKVEMVDELEQEVNATFQAVARAIKPKKPVPPLKNKQFSFYISEKVASAKLERDAARLKIDNSRLHLAGIYSEKRDSVIHGGLAVDSSLVSAIRLSFGTRAYLALLNEENSDVFATALGLEAAYNLPFEKLPLEFSASFYYAPDILTFGSADRSIDAQVDFAFPLRENSSVFAGARFLQMDVTPEDREIDNRVHMGIRWNFMK